MNGSLDKLGVRPVSLAKLSLIVPSPVPVLTETVQVVPEPVTELIEAPETPVVVKLKLLAVSPVIEAAKVTVKETLLALVGELAARTIELTVVAVAGKYNKVTYKGAFVPPLPQLPPLVFSFNWILYEPPVVKVYSN